MSNHTREDIINTLRREFPGVSVSATELVVDIALAERQASNDPVRRAEADNMSRMLVRLKQLTE